MFRPKDIDNSPAARAIVHEVAERLKELAGDDASAEEVRQAALDVMAIALRDGKDGVSPPWAPPWVPPRYRLADERIGATKELAVDGTSLSVTLNFYPDGPPAELFISQRKAGQTIGALLDALATVVSVALQHGVPWRVLSGKLIRTNFPPSGWTGDDDNELKHVTSVLDYVFRWADKQVNKWAK